MDPLNNFFSYLMVFSTILLTVCAQFIVKWQAVSAGTLPAGWPDRVSFVVKLLLNPWIIGAYAMAILASITWMLAMTRLELSHAYPMTALTFVIVVIGGGVIFAEPLTLPKIAGLVLIVIGIIVGSQG